MSQWRERVTNRRITARRRGGGILLFVSLAAGISLMEWKSIFLLFLFDPPTAITPTDDGDDSDGDLVTDYLNATNNNNSSSNGPSGIAPLEGSLAGGSTGAGARQQQHPQSFSLQQQQSLDLSTGTTATTATTSNTTTPRSSRGSIHLYSNNSNGAVSSGKGGSGPMGFSGGGVGQNGGSGGGGGAYNMVPIISVTPHSPGTKFSGILGEWNEDFIQISLNRWHLECGFTKRVVMLVVQ